MFNNVKDLKEFLLWCKDNNMLHVQIEDTSFTFSENLVAIEKAGTNIDNMGTLSKDVSNNPTDADDDETLFWST
jgi:hypothetical protein